MHSMDWLEPNISTSRNADARSSWFVDLVSNKPKLLFQSFTGRSSEGLRYVYKGHTNSAGQPHGPGKMKFENGDIYDGEWLKGKLHGYASAKLFSPGNLKEYEGEFQNGKQHGLGKFTWSDGEFYDGEWKSGLFHGPGIYGTPDGVQMSCNFSFGLPDLGCKCQVSSCVRLMRDNCCTFMIRPHAQSCARLM